MVFPVHVLYGLRYEMNEWSKYCMLGGISTKHDSQQHLQFFIRIYLFFFFHKNLEKKNKNLTQHPA